MHSVTVQLRVSELLAATFRLMRGMRFFKLLFVVMLITCVWQERRHFSDDGVIAVISLVATAVLFTGGALVLAFFLQAALVIVRARRNPAVLGPRQYTIGPDGLRVRADAGEQVLSPGDITGLAPTRRALYVKLSSRAWHILPRRCFANPAAYDEFWNALQARVAKPER